MKRLRNLTLHEQGDREIRLAAAAGYELPAAAEGVVVGMGRDSLEVAAASLADLLAQALREGSAVLLGGHTGLWVRSLEILQERGISAPEMVYFETARLRDAEGKFIFAPTGLVSLGTRCASSCGESR